MIGLDTNVLVRYLAQDDRRQSAAATRLIEALTVEEPGFIAHATLVELAWVLESCYDATRATVRDTLSDLLRTRTLRLQDAETVARALRAFATGHADFSDCLIAAASTAAGCGAVYSFDKAAIRNAGMTQVP